MFKLIRFQRPQFAAICLMAAMGSLQGEPAMALAPQPRARHIAVYDPVRQRMIMWGGDNGSQLFSNDVWSLSLSDPLTWSKLKVRVEGSIGHGTRGAAAVYDSRRAVIYVHGGAPTVTSQPIGNLLQLSFPTADSAVWVGLIQDGNAPTDRMYHAMVYDSLGDRVYLFGGQDEGTRFDDTYQMEPSNLGPGHRLWTRIETPSSPSPRYGCAYFFDVVRRRMVVMGGVGHPNEGGIGPTWALSVSGSPTWAQIYSFGGPANLRFASAMYQPPYDRAYITGGWFNPMNMNLNGYPWIYWMFNESQSGWGYYDAIGPEFNEIYQHTTVHDRLGNRLIKFGGATVNFGYTDTPVGVTGEAWQLALHQDPYQAVWSPIATGGGSGQGSRGSGPSTGTSASKGVSGEGAVIVSGGMGATPIQFKIAGSTQIAGLRVDVFDVQGRLIRALRAPGGDRLDWNRQDTFGRGVGPGIYFYRATIGRASRAGKLVLVR